LEEKINLTKSFIDIKKEEYERLMNELEIDMMKII